jgi:hypothetical protein
MNSRRFKEAVYVLKAIDNYWRRLNDEDLISNPFPHFIGQDARDKPEWLPVTKVLRDGVYEFPQFVRGVPFDFHERLVFRRNEGKTQQALRIRVIPDPETKEYKEKWFIIAGNDFFPNIVIDEPVLADQLLGYIRYAE